MVVPCVCRIRSWREAKAAAPGKLLPQLLQASSKVPRFSKSMNCPWPPPPPQRRCALRRARKPSPPGMQRNIPSRVPVTVTSAPASFKVFQVRVDILSSCGGWPCSASSGIGIQPSCQDQQSMVGASASPVTEPCTSRDVKGQHRCRTSRFLPCANATGAPLAVPFCRRPRSTPQAAT